MIKTITAPKPFFNWKGGIFLAGTIENGNSIDWQSKLIDKVNEFGNYTKDVSIINPRRKEWDNTIDQSINCPELFQQMSWEKEGLERADYIIFNFLNSSVSPITLLELGLWASSGKCIVVCPVEFWRAGNVEFICNQYKIPLYRTMEELIKVVFNIYK